MSHNPLDAPIEPPINPGNLPHLIRIVESLSIVALLVGILFSFLNYPFSGQLSGIGLLGLGTTYGALFCMRVYGLKNGLPITDFRFLFGGGLGLGIALASSGFSHLFYEWFYFNWLNTAFIVANWAGAITVIVCWFYIAILKGPGQPQTLYFAIAAWLKTRLGIYSVLFVLSFVLGGLLSSIAIKGGLASLY